MVRDICQDYCKKKVQEYFFESKVRKCEATRQSRQPLKATIPLQVVTDDINARLAEIADGVSLKGEQLKLWSDNYDKGDDVMALADEIYSDADGENGK